MQNVTLALLVQNSKICLGIKKRKFGKDKYNGFGGKQKENETLEQTALRELTEETGVIAKKYQKVGEMTYVFPANPEWNQLVHIYLITSWEGEPKETEEMTAEWFTFDKIPYDRMWDNDKYWLPEVLAGKKVKGLVEHNTSATAKKDIQIVDKL